MRPSILGFFTVGMTTLSMLSVSCVLYSAGSGVKRVLVVLSGLRWSWFCCVHEAISLSNLHHHLYHFSCCSGSILNDRRTRKMNFMCVMHISQLLTCATCLCGLLLRNM